MAVAVGDAAAAASAEDNETFQMKREKSSPMSSPTFDSLSSASFARSSSWPSVTRSEFHGGDHAPDLMSCFSNDDSTPLDTCMTDGGNANGGDSARESTANTGMNNAHTDRRDDDDDDDVLSEGFGPPFDRLDGDAEARLKHEADDHEGRLFKLETGRSNIFRQSFRSVYEDIPPAHKQLRRATMPMSAGGAAAPLQAHHSLAFSETRERDGGGGGSGLSSPYLQQASRHSLAGPVSPILHANRGSLSRSASPSGGARISPGTAAATAAAAAGLATGRSHSPGAKLSTSTAPQTQQFDQDPLTRSRSPGVYAHPDQNTAALTTAANAGAVVASRAAATSTPTACRSSMSGSAALPSSDSGLRDPLSALAAGDSPLNLPPTDKDNESKSGGSQMSVSSTSSSQSSASIATQSLTLKIPDRTSQTDDRNSKSPCDFLSSTEDDMDDISSESSLLLSAPLSNTPLAMKCQLTLSPTRRQRRLPPSTTPTPTPTPPTTPTLISGDSSSSSRPAPTLSTANDRLELLRNQIQRQRDSRSASATDALLRRFDSPSNPHKLSASPDSLPHSTRSRTRHVHRSRNLDNLSSTYAASGTRSASLSPRTKKRSRISSSELEHESSHKSPRLPSYSHVSHHGSHHVQFMNRRLHVPADLLRMGIGAAAGIGTSYGGSGGRSSYSQSQAHAGLSSGQTSPQYAHLSPHTPRSHPLTSAHMNPLFGHLDRAPKLELPQSMSHLSLGSTSVAQDMLQGVAGDVLTDATNPAMRQYPPRRLHGSVSAPCSPLARPASAAAAEAHRHGTAMSPNPPHPSVMPPGMPMPMGGYVHASPAAPSKRELDLEREVLKLRHELEQLKRHHGGSSPGGGSSGASPHSNDDSSGGTIVRKRIEYPPLSELVRETREVEIAKRWCKLCRIQAHNIRSADPDAPIKVECNWIQIWLVPNPKRNQPKRLYTCKEPNCSLKTTRHLATISRHCHNSNFRSAHTLRSYSSPYIPALKKATNCGS